MLTEARVRGRDAVVAPLGRHLEAGLLAGIIVFAAAVRLWSFAGIVRLDSLRYMEVANHVFSGGSLFDPQVFYASSRLTLFVPLLASVKLGGWGEHVATAWPLLCSLIAVFAVWLAGRELYGPRVGLLAAFGMACVPIEIELATQLLPDPLEGAFIVLSVALAILAITRDRYWRAAAIGAGVALGAAYFTRVNVLVFLPGILAVGAILDTAKWKRSLWALAGLAGVLVAAAITFWFLSGDPFIDWTRTSSFYSDYSSGGFIFRGERFWRQFLTVIPLLWLYPALALGTGWAILDRSRATWLTLAWVYGFWFYLDVVSPLHGLDTSYRYAEPMVAPTLILFAGAVWWLYGVFPRVVRWVPVVTAVLCFALVVPVGHTLGVKWRRTARWQAVRRAAIEVTKPGDTTPVIVQSPYIPEAINYYAGYTLGRDTLEPADAPVNEGTRLFTEAERPFRPGERVWYVGQWAPKTDDPVKLVAKYRYPGEPLRVYLVNP